MLVLALILEVIINSMLRQQLRKREAVDVVLGMTSVKIKTLKNTLSNSKLVMKELLMKLFTACYRMDTSPASVLAAMGLEEQEKRSWAGPRQETSKTIVCLTALSHYRSTVRISDLIR